MAGKRAIPMPMGLLKSSERELIASCQESGSELGISWHVHSSASIWLLAVLQEECAVAVLDCEKTDAEHLAWVQLARRLRPKVPLLVFHDAQIDNAAGAKLCEEKVFYFCPRPVDRGLLRQVLQAALRASDSLARLG